MLALGGITMYLCACVCTWQRRVYTQRPETFSLVRCVTRRGMCDQKRVKLARGRCSHATLTCMCAPI